MVLVVDELREWEAVRAGDVAAAVFAGVAAAGIDAVVEDRVAPVDDGDAGGMQMALHVLGVDDEGLELER